MRRVISIVAGLALLIISVAAPAGAGITPGPGPAGARLSKHDHELLAKARTQGQPTVTVMIAAQPGQNKTVAAGIAKLGGTVQYREDELGYIRAAVPIGKAQDAAALRGVQAINLDEIIPLDDPEPQAAPRIMDVAPPGPATPPQNPYMPTRDIGAPQFVAAHPTYDGRGVTIGIIDTGVDLLTPELQVAYTLTGQPTTKIVDWITATDPLFDDDPTWVYMQDAVSVMGGSQTFVHDGQTYEAPGFGQFRLGFFDERDPRLGDEVGNDVNRDGNPPGANGVFAVLWEYRSNTVWVDTNQNFRFSDERPMTDYKVQRDVGSFGTDNPATPVRESMPFVVQTDGPNQMVNIGIVSGAHGTHVAGIAAGNGFFGGAFHGAAPGAKIISVRVCLFISGCTSHALIEGMIYAAQTAKVDVINMSIGGLPALNDGQTARDLLYDRLIERYKVQMFISAGNSGAGINTVGDPSVANTVMSVGAYVHKDTWLANYGAAVSKDDGMFTFSSRGPREDGGFKPNIVAPGAAISSIPLWQPGSPVPGTYPLPPGYGMFNGTSMAAPQATGGAALLISAAKQAGVQYRPDQLRQAIMSSARYLPGYAPHEQGAGLFQVGAAWELLRTNIRTVSIASDAPVNTILSDFLVNPGRGPGLHEREGWAPGQSGQRTLTFTRTSGGAQAVSYQVGWVGNDGTFSSAGQLSLPKGTPVDLPVSVHAATPGVHSAILTLDDPATAGIDYYMMNTVVAAADFDAGNTWTVTTPGSADRTDMATFFYRIPAGTAALKLDTTGISGRVRLTSFHPYGVPFTVTAYQTDGSQSHTLAGPTPGVWEVVVDASRASPQDPSAFTISGAVLGVETTPAIWSVDPAEVGATASQNFTFTNLLAPFTGGAAGTILGSAYTERPTIAHHGYALYMVDVAPGSEAFTARIGSPSDLAADLDLLVYDPDLNLAGYAADGDSEEAVTIQYPAPGTWYVLVDAYAVPAGYTEYDYLDVYTNPDFGAITVMDSPAPHANGDTWTVPAEVTPTDLPSPGRFLLGYVQVESDGAIISSSPVQLNNFAEP